MSRSRRGAQRQLPHGRGRPDPLQGGRRELRSDERGHERLDDGGVELGAGARAQLGDRLGGGDGTGVGALGDHRVERVAHEDDPRAQRDLLAVQAVGVAATVVALVAGAHELRHRAQGGGGFEDALAEDRVAAHE